MVMPSVVCGRRGDWAGMSTFAKTILHNKHYAHIKSNGDRETWAEVAERQARCVVRPYLPHLEGKVRQAIEDRKFMPAGRYLYAAGRPYPQISNCFLFKTDDSREGWADHMHDCTHALMTGGGVGGVYSDLRPENYQINGMGGRSTGPLALMNMTNEAGRHIMQGGSRRTALWAGLHWWHPDVFKFITMKDWPENVRLMKAADFTFPCPMDGTNISVILDNDFFAAYNTPGWRKTYRLGHSTHEVDHAWARRVYWAVVRHMLETAEPGLSVDVGEHDGENLRNACCESCSRDNGDNCNLASINMARVSGPDEMAELVDLGMAFLLCGTLYGVLPTPRMVKIREKNRRLGLGLMGVHEWLLRRGRRYGPDEELGRWLEPYARSGEFANAHALVLGTAFPVGNRSVAPNGTIGIVGETTTSAEPVFAVAVKRRYLDGAVWKYQYVVDATARRLIDDGVDPSLIEDAYDLADNFEGRVNFQAWLQARVDQGISSTINLPAWGSAANNENRVTEYGNILMKYLPKLRGITAYPDGARGGQPLNRLRYADVVGREGVIYEENEERCSGGICGT